jgi:RimJ/RimL family protein N-acetyltransferase
MSPVHLPSQVITERLVLRPWQERDAPELTAAVSESRERLWVFMPWVAHYDNSDASSEFIARSQRERTAGYELSLAIIERATGRIVGSSGYHSSEPTESGWRSLEIGYWLREGEEGKGYMREAVRAQVRLAFALGIERLQLLCDARNLRSASVAEACGFRLEALLRRQARDHHGVLRDTRVYSITRAESPDLIARWADESFELEWSDPPFERPIVEERPAHQHDSRPDPPSIVTELLQLDPAELPKPGLHYTVIDRNSRRHLGIATITTHSPDVPSFELTWSHRTADEPIEFGIEMVLALLKLTFEEFNAERVEMRVPERSASDRLIAEITGFEREGVLRAHRSPTTHDIDDFIIYSVIKDDL